VIKVFCYGTLKRGHGNNRFLKESEFVGEAISTESNYFMVGRAIPFLYEGGCQFVSGEVWSVSEEVLKRLDQLEGHPRMYRREMRTFIVDGETITAWVYLMWRDKRGWPMEERYDGPVISWPPPPIIDQRVADRIDGYDLGESPDY
jgi:gamma-glutamylcyclotransferase (GGCT)/AIG2-like uncharacterized protein YtfP